MNTTGKPLKLAELFYANNHDPILKAGENMVRSGCGEGAAMLEMINAYHSEREAMLNEVIRLNSLEIPKGLIIDAALLRMNGVEL